MARKEKETTQTTKTYTVESPVAHDGRRYEIGEEIELQDDAQAQALLAVGAISLPGDRAATDEDVVIE